MEREAIELGLVLMEVPVAAQRQGLAVGRLLEEWRPLATGWPSAAKQEAASKWLELESERQRAAPLGFHSRVR